MWSLVLRIGPHPGANLLSWPVLLPHNRSSWSNTCTKKTGTHYIYRKVYREINGQKSKNVCKNIFYTSSSQLSHPTLHSALHLSLNSLFSSSTMTSTCSHTTAAIGLTHAQRWTGNTLYRMAHSLEKCVQNLNVQNLTIISSVDALHYKHSQFQTATKGVG